MHEKAKRLRVKYLFKPITIPVDYLWAVARIFTWQGVFYRGTLIALLMAVLGISDFAKNVNQADLLALLIAGCIIIAVIGLSCKARVMALAKCEFVNQLDFAVVSITLGCSVYFLMKFSTQLLTRGEPGLMSILDGAILEVYVICYHAMLKRAIFLNDIIQEGEPQEKSRKDNGDKKETYLLGDLYWNTIPQGEKHIFLEDKEASYDLLGREKDIQDICNIIESCRNHSHMVIAIKGPWGSGKTTLFKNAQEKLDPNIVVVDKFEPWELSDEDSDMVWSCLFDAIMRKIKKNAPSILQTVNTINTYMSVIRKVIGVALPEIGVTNAEFVKGMIEDYVSRNNKKIVVSIDNLERCSSANIEALLKAVNLIDINGLNFVLLFDDAVMRKRIEALGLEYRYLEKIIQVEFNVSALNEERIDKVVEKCTKNYARTLRIKLSPTQISIIKRILPNHIGNIRDLTRIINSVFDISLNSSTDLDKIDLFCIELLHFQNPDLWREIRDHMDCFVSINNKKVDHFLEGLIGDDGERRKKYIESLISNNKLHTKDYKDILGLMFPVLGDNTFSYYKSSDGRISDGDFFDTFFDRSKNLKSVADQKARQFIEDVVSGALIADNIPEWHNTNIKSEELLMGFRESFVIKNINERLGSIPDEKLPSDILNILCRLYWEADRSMNFRSRVFNSARSQVASTLFELLLRIGDDNRFKDELDAISRNYGDAEIMFKLQELTRMHENREGSTDAARCEAISSNLKLMIKNILDNKINLYSKEYYHYGSSMLLYGMLGKNYWHMLGISLSSPEVPLVVAGFVKHNKNNNEESCYAVNLQDLKLVSSKSEEEDILKIVSQWPKHELTDVLRKIINAGIDDVTIYEDADAHQQRLDEIHNHGEYISSQTIDFDSLTQDYIQTIL